jgi:hypothetical protein
VNRVPILLAAAAKDRIGAIAVLERTLQTKAMAATILDGEKFALLVPTNLVKSISAELGAMTYPNATDDTLPAGTILMRSTPMSQVLPIYGELIGRKLVRDNPLPHSLISFHTQTVLSKAEVVYAFDILFQWQGWKIVVVDDRTFRVIPAKGR